MKHLSTTIICAAMLIAAGTALAEDIESKLEFNLSADFFGKYVWRGQNLNDDPVFQPGASVTYEGLTAGVWGNLDLTSINGESGEFTEVDYFLDYSADVPGVEGVGFSVGIINYHFPSVAGDTTELYWGFSFDTLLSPSITVYHDIDQVDGTYASLAIGHTFEDIFTLESGESVGLELSASLGYADSDYNTAYWGVNSSKANDLTTSIAIPFEIAGISVTPSLNYVTLLSDTMRATDSYDTSSDYFFAGISFSKSF